MPIPLPPPQPRPVRRAVDRPNLLQELRKELISYLQSGQVEPGDRLPSIRALAREKKLDHRIVANAYRSLEEEGLVEIRGRSGVVAAKPDPAPQPGMVERSSWVAGVLNGAWQKKLGQKELSNLLARCLDSSSLCCVCVESNCDAMLAFTTEIESVSGITAIPLYMSASPEVTGSDDGERMRQILSRADLVVTTELLVSTVRSILGSSSVPLVTIRINQDLAEAIRSRVQGRGLTIVAATREFGERIRAIYAEEGDAVNIRVVLAADREAIGKLDRSSPILLTRAAREMAPALADFELVYPHSPTIDAATLEALSEAVVTVNLRQISA